MAKRTIAVDFDATISSYDGYRGRGIFGDPIQNAKWALDLLKNELGHTIIVYTCRLEVDLVREYMIKHELPFDYINFNPNSTEMDLHPAKIVADLYVDDRAISFRGDWRETVSNIAKYRNWTDDNTGAIRGGGDGI